MNRREAIATMLASGTLFAPRAARAQHGFPDRPIRIIVPVSPGGGVDTFGRLIAAKIEAQRHVQFVVENRTGGNGTIAGLDVHRAGPDGYTLLFHASTHNVARPVMRDAPYDPLTGFTPIALAAERRLDALGIEPAAETPEGFVQFLHADLNRSAKLLKAANFQPQ
jgi:tripartite-type tricarboxylate transporter receptor subunit TctC